MAKARVEDERLSTKRGSPQALPRVRIELDEFTDITALCWERGTPVPLMSSGPRASSALMIKRIHMRG
jgi:hypothetical protein